MKIADEQKCKECHEVVKPYNLELRGKNRFSSWNVSIGPLKKRSKNGRETRKSYKKDTRQTATSEEGECTASTAQSSSEAQSTNVAEEGDDNHVKESSKVGERSSKSDNWLKKVTDSTFIADESTVDASSSTSQADVIDDALTNHLAVDIAV